MSVLSLNEAKKVKQMAKVFIGVGSNIDCEANIRAGIKAMKEHFSNLSVSTVYESSSVGFSGDNFLNLIVAMETDLGAVELQDKLHEIEADFGRVRGGQRYVSRTLDLDLLLYDDLIVDEKDLQLPREDVTKFAFVLKPLAEIAGSLRHPVSGISYSELWKNFEQSDQKLWPVEIDL